VRIPAASKQFIAAEVMAKSEGTLKEWWRKEMKIAITACE
jgi:hypothetical protein